MNSVGLLNSSSTASLNSNALLSGAGQKQVEKKLDSFQQSKGLSPDERASLKSELKTAFESALKNSSFPPDFQKLQGTLTEVFKKHGLDANELLASMPKPPSTVSDGSNAALAAYASADASQSNLDILQSAYKDASTKDATLSFDDFSEQILSQMTHISVRA